ncbi:MAG: ral L-amino acid transport system permease protein [Alphaproteobacteria bacterium]|jgi:general L-amino acid transport system permease protein|nr:ral L-amino acid transport system permease protein [Alphaproteobacteria bacterium]
MTAIEDEISTRAPRVALYRNPRVRGIFIQVILVLVVLWLGYEFAGNARTNLQAQKIATGFGFLDQNAGFDVNFSLLPHQETNTYRHIFLIGLLNTLLVSVLGIVIATILGFIIGIARLSNNWLIARLATFYVELIRNQPLLFQLLFWYLAVLGTLPGTRQSISIFDEIFLSNRGIVMPRPVFSEGTRYVVAAFALGIFATLVLRYWARRRQAATGQPFPVLWPSLGLILGLPLVALVATGFPIDFERPKLVGFNFVGGMRLFPEFVALLIALGTYTASFIAEVVRAGIQAVSRGQTEAAYSLGLPRGLTMRLVVMPQALRVIIPPLASQYLNLTKNTSLAVGIGYPDLFAVFAGTALNQTGQSIEIIAITMATYLVISLATSLLMNIYNARMRLVER